MTYWPDADYTYGDWQRTPWYRFFEPSYRRPVFFLNKRIRWEYGDANSAS